MNMVLQSFLYFVVFFIGYFLGYIVSTLKKEKYF